MSAALTPRDVVALALLKRIAERGSNELIRRAVIREAFAWADEFMLQRAVGMPVTDVAAVEGCINGFKRHKWVNNMCVRCEAFPSANKRPGKPTPGGRRIQLAKAVGE